MTHAHCPPPQGASAAGRAAALVGATALSGLFLAACGGNSDGPPPAPPPAPATAAPASAAASDLALETFAFNLPQSEDAEPLTLELVPTLPASETDEPIATP